MGHDQKLVPAEMAGQLQSVRGLRLVHKTFWIGRPVGLAVATSVIRHRVEAIGEGRGNLAPESAVSGKSVDEKDRESLPGAFVRQANAVDRGELERAGSHGCLICPIGE